MEQNRTEWPLRAPPAGHGRTVITNMNPEHLPNAKRKRWQDSTVQALPNAILIDLRPKGPGGIYAVRGLIELRSLYET